MFSENEKKLLVKVLTEYKNNNLHDIKDRILKKHVNRLLTKIKKFDCKEKNS